MFSPLCTTRKVSPSVDSVSRLSEEFNCFKQHVRVYGPGVEPGVLAMFQSRSLCDTRGAGAGQLTVRVRGPKGAFRVEMQRENQKDRTILCKFSPTEPGDYRVEVRWAGRRVPGSPFPVMIFDTQEELRRYIQATAT